MKNQGKSPEDIGLVVDPRSYFNEIVADALSKRKVHSPPLVTSYLVQLLETNVTTDKLHLKGTMAEFFLKSFNAEKTARIELLKKLGDTSLYISGFFGDSLRRKIVDIDYYADIGGMAYANLASQVNNDMQAEVFREFSQRFLSYVDVLTYISQTTMVQTNQDILRLYERYIATGSELAKDQLAEKGIVATVDKKKASQ
jgi:Mor family transcriptional regulator